MPMALIISRIDPLIRKPRALGLTKSVSKETIPMMAITSRCDKHNGQGSKPFTYSK